MAWHGIDHARPSVRSSRPIRTAAPRRGEVHAVSCRPAYPPRHPTCAKPREPRQCICAPAVSGAHPPPRVLSFLLPASCFLLPLCVCVSTTPRAGAGAGRSRLPFLSLSKKQLQPHPAFTPRHHLVPHHIEEDQRVFMSPPFTPVASNRSLHQNRKEEEEGGIRVTPTRFPRFLLPLTRTHQDKATTTYTTPPTRRAHQTLLAEKRGSFREDFGGVRVRI